jgi:hypothetical protein
VNFYSSDPRLFKGAPKSNSIREFRDENRFTYLKFDLSEIDSDDVSGGRLELFNDNTFAKGKPNEGSRVTVEYVKDDSWKEREITFNNQPTDISGKVDVPHTDLKDWVEIDVSSFIKEAFHDDKILTLKIGSEEGAYMSLPRKGLYSPKLIVVPSESN